MDFPTSKIFFATWILAALLGGYLIGSWSIEPPKREPKMTDFVPEISLISVEKIAGDELFFSISGPARVIWSGQMVENDGEFRIPLAQIPNENDLELEDFPFVGNAKTQKFYPSDSYFARGVEVKYRRFFDSKDAAIAAGFAPTRGVK